jgi:mannose-6-phosphate isomerase
MAIEHARVRAVPKPWGVVDLYPWSNAGHDGSAIGEIWYERAENTTVAPSLLLKLLFTSQSLSIQVHPDDAFAHSIGQPNGKTEAWCILSAAPGAKVALGLNQRLTPLQLRDAIADGSIRDLIVWRTVLAGDVISVPAGTIHAIGAGLVVAELQQRSDATFRLFDYGRNRELDIENAIATADAGPADFQVRPNQLTAERKLLISNPYFVFERIELAPNSNWYLEAERETWLLVLSGGATAGPFDVATGDALFAQSDRVGIHAGAIGVVGLAGYTGGDPIPHLLRPRMQPGSINVRGPPEMQVPPSLTQATAAPKNGRLETIK